MSVRSPLLRRSPRPLSSHCVRSIQPRTFSTTRAHNSLLDTTTTLLTTLHSSAGLPWHTLIPLTAFSVRLLFTTPFTLYARVVQRRITRLVPLLQAHSHLILLSSAPTAKAPDLKSWSRQLGSQYRQTRREILKRHGAQRWKGYVGLVQIPVFVFASANIRALTGRADGLVEFLSPAASEGKSIGAAAAEGFCEEGLWWCADLAVPDPALALPAVFAATLWGNAMLQRGRMPETAGKMQKRFANALLVLGVAALPIAAGMPAGVVLYWASSGVFSLAQNVLLDTMWKGKTSVEEEVAKGLRNLEKGKDLMELRETAESAKRDMEEMRQRRERGEDVRVWKRVP